MTRSYSELVRIPTFLERYRYLSVRGVVGCETFGFNRWLNQQFYTSRLWRHIRRDVIARDGGCDLGISGYEIHHRPIVHHMNPLVEEDIAHGTPNATNLEFLILTTHRTHNAIHFGDENLLVEPYKPRRPGDTKLW